MKQTLATLLVTVLLLVSLVGCGEKKDNGAVTGKPDSTTDGGAMDSNKKDDTTPGDDMSGTDANDESVTGDGMMGDELDDTDGSARRSAGRRSAAASASGRSRYFGSGKTYLNPETERSANAQLRSNGRSLTGMTLDSNDLRYRRMLSNGRVHDTDGFLFDGENTHYNTLR